MKKHFYTFDVFDTLITRKTATPFGIFSIMQMKLINDIEFKSISEYVRENFYYLRINSEILARQTYCHIVNDKIEEITLKDIYLSMASTGCLTDKDVDILMNLEKMTEYENVVAIDININKIKRLFLAGEKLALISDMYLDSFCIKKMLLKVDKIFNNIPLYVSSQYKKTKVTGNLYKVVKNIENIKFEQWVHFGDNLLSDIDVSRRLGIKAFHCKYEEFLQCELNIIKANEDRFSCQSMIGLARNIRLAERSSKLKHVRIAFEIGSSIAGPVLFPYVWWIIKESIRKNINSLYFIARDGFILKKIADIIIEKNNYNIKTKYIYGSRKAWRMASFSCKNNDIYRLIYWSHFAKINNIGKLAAVFQIPVSEFCMFLPKGYFSGGQKITQSTLHWLTKYLNKNDKFKMYLIKKHESKKERVVSYLKQEVDFSKNDFAFVDLGGGGFTQYCLAEIISGFYLNPIRTFFFKMEKINNFNNCLFYNFLPSSLYLSLILEMLCRAPHGQTAGYENFSGKIKPILQMEENTAIIKHGFGAYLKGLKIFCENYVEHKKNELKQVNDIKLVLSYIKEITINPETKILNYLADMPNNETGRETQLITFAPKLSKKTIRDIFLLHIDEPKENYYKGSSIEYSLLRCSSAEKKKVAFYQKKRKEILKRFKCLYKKDLIKEEKEKEFLEIFPYEILERKIILYGAGKMGRILYKMICKKHQYKIIQWVDKKSDEYAILGLPVENPNVIGEKYFDQIVIAVLDEAIAIEVKKYLYQRGISENQIVWVNPKVQWLL